MEKINNKQAISIITLFIMGSTLLIGSGTQAKSDSWLAVIIGILMALPFVLIYSRILTVYRGKDFFDILQIVFGKIIGKIIILLYVLYAFYLGSVIIRNFGEFINVAALPETPIFVPMLFIGLLCTMVVRSGVEVLGRSSLFFFPLLLIIIFIVSLLSIPNYDLTNFKPILAFGITSLLEGSISAFSFPFAETVLLMSIMFSLQPKKSIYKTFTTGLLLGGGIVLLINIRNLLVLGSEIREILYFPSHLAVSRISIGDFVQRIEVTVAIVFVISVLVKAGVCLYAACKGISKLFGLKNYRVIVFQVGLLMILFSNIIFENIMEMDYFAFKVYSYFAFPFQVILPIIILIGAEIKIRSEKSPTLSSEA